MMEKTVYPELPQKLELTAKVEKLELSAVIPAALAMTSLYGAASLTSRAAHRRTAASRSSFGS